MGKRLLAFLVDPGELERNGVTIGFGQRNNSKSNFWPSLGSSRFSGSLTLTLFCQTKSVEKERERKEGKEERKEKGGGGRGEEGGRERGGCAVYMVLRMPKEERRL